MAKETPYFPIIEFHDMVGVVHKIMEIKEDKNFDRAKRITYTTYKDKAFHFLIKER